MTASDCNKCTTKKNNLCLYTLPFGSSVKKKYFYWCLILLLIINTFIQHLIKIDSKDIYTTSQKILNSKIFNVF